MTDIFQLNYLYSILIFIGVLWFLKTKMKPKKNTFDKYYGKVLESDKYKVKGKFES